MQSFPDMAEAHAWTLQRLREMAGRLTEQAYARASEAAGDGDDESSARWMLVFDRMARGLRLTLALEARLARERRWDADEIGREAQGQRHAPRWRRPAAPDPRVSADSEPCESDGERDDDGLPCDAPLGQRIDRLKAIIETAGSPEPEPEPPPRQSLRARRAALPHGGASDVLAAAQRMDGHVADGEAPPWRGSG